MPKMLFADRLRLARKTRKLSVKVVAARLGISPAAVRHHENAFRVPDIALLYQYAALYKVTADWLYLGRGEGPSSPQDKPDEPEPGDQRAARAVLRALAKRRGGVA